MSENDLPMMPFFVKDWIAATSHWSDAERGAYISLLAFQWVNGNVPPDVSQLARIMGTPDEEFERRWATVGKKFDGDKRRLFNNRLEEHRKEAMRLRQAHTLGATLANEKRRAKRGAQRVPHDVPQDDAQCNEGVTPTSTSTSFLRLPPSEIPEGISSEGKLSNGTHTRSANAQRASRGTRWDDEKWITFKLAYPHRVGGYDWQGAMKAWRARLAEGHKWEELLEGVLRYSRYCEAAQKIGTEFVMQAKTFCGPGQRFLEEWEIPASGEAWSPPSDEAVDPP
jgi:uncharacterized protein YdaU (DUF1376 family)